MSAPAGPPSVRRVLLYVAVGVAVLVLVIVLAGCSSEVEEARAQRQSDAFEGSPSVSLTDVTRIQVPGYSYPIVAGCWNGVRVFRAGSEAHGGVSAVPDSTCPR